jgi:O-antigen/teichoic acid export membrane protein
MLISPVVLVRFLTVAQFGVYREFLLYGSVLSSIAAFNINNGLMYFVPAHPANSLLVIGVTAALNAATHDAIVGAYLLPLAAYTFFFVNVDFWEYLWLSKRQPQRVLVYTVVRLAARLAVVVAAAALSRDVDTIIWWLVGFEGLRMLISFVLWRLRSAPLGEPMPGSWRLQIASCLPLGGSLILMTLLRNAGSLFVTKMMGAAALAQFTVGTYVAPIVVVLRNSISDALLPEMSARRASEPEHALQLWQKSTVVFALLLLPAAVLLARFARPIIVTLFSGDYSEAIPVFQLYAILLVRECADFGVLIRAVDQNRLLLRANLLALAVNLALLAVMVPALGLRGAVLAYLCARFAEGLLQLWQVSRLFGLAMRKLVPWTSILRVSAAAVLAFAVLSGQFWESFGLAGVACGSLLYLMAFAALVWFLGVPEARTVAARMRELLMVRFR